MLDIAPTSILQAAATALERMAFISIDPIDDAHPAAPPNALRVRVPLTQPDATAVEMIAPLALGCADRRQRHGDGTGPGRLAERCKGRTGGIS